MCPQIKSVMKKQSSETIQYDVVKVGDKFVTILRNHPIPPVSRNRKNKKTLSHYINISTEIGSLSGPLLEKLDTIPDEKGELRYIKHKISEVYNLVNRHHHRVCVNSVN